MANHSFKDILAWQKAHALTVDIYAAFSSCRDYSFRDQIKRASLSIINNITEGYARRSDKVLKIFLFIAKGSAAEVESMSIIASDLRYIDSATQKKLIGDVDTTSRIISGFINKLSARDS